MSFIAPVALAAILSGGPAGSAPAQAQTPIDGHIVRVVYKVGSKGTWGFHLAHMRDGRYCFRLGNPGRLTLDDIRRLAHICFDNVPRVAAITFGGFLTGELSAASLATAIRGSAAEVAAQKWAVHEPAASSKVWLVGQKAGQSKARKRGKRLKRLRGVNLKGASPIPDPPARR
jgi:hypothetical protein